MTLINLYFEGSEKYHSDFEATSKNQLIIRQLRYNIKSFFSFIKNNIEFNIRFNTVILSFMGLSVCVRKALASEMR